MSGTATRLALGLALCLAWLGPVSTWLATPWVVVGESMAPTLRDGERVLVDRWTYDRRPPRAGEVALVRLRDGRLLVKRVGEGGDPSAGIPVYGDNRAASDDSRRFGPVARGAVLGRVVARYWPPWRASLVHPRPTPPGGRSFLEIPHDRSCPPPARNRLAAGRPGTAADGRGIDVAAAEIPRIEHRAGGEHCGRNDRRGGPVVP